MHKVNNTRKYWTVNKQAFSLIPIWSIWQKKKEKKEKNNISGSLQNNRNEGQNNI